MAEKDSDSSIHIDVTSQNELRCILIQSKIMKDLVLRFPEILFVDGTYKLNCEGYPLYPIMCQDSNGRGRPVAYLWVKDESKESLTHAFHIFATYNKSILEKTKVLMVDKDFNEINCLKEVFTKAKVLLCTFHVIKYNKGKVQDLEIKRNQKSEIMCIIQKLIYAKSKLDFNEQVKILETIAPAAFFMYFTANWLNCVEMWAHYPRLTISTFGNNTNNRIESHNQKLKRFIRATSKLDQAISELQKYIKSVEESLSTSKFVELQTCINTKNMQEGTTDTSVLLGKFCTKAGVVRVNPELACSSYKYTIVKHDSGFTVTGKKRNYMVDNMVASCSCKFNNDNGLPCRHIFAVRRHSKLEMLTLDMIPDRWRKIAMRQSHSSNDLEQNELTLLNL